MATCSICAGTGKTVQMRSWFPTDGYYRIRCGICAGTGRSSYRNATYANEQKRLRTLATAGGSDAS